MSDMFPQLRDVKHESVRLKNVARRVYLCVKKDNEGNNFLGTKTINQEIDPDVDFSLYYYSSAEVEETKMVLPVHQATSVCLSMTADKKLEKSCLKNISINTNEMDDMMEDPNRFNTADNRFFYIKSSGSDIALEAMNGIHGQNYLSVNENNQLDIQEHNNTNFPEELLFSVEYLGSTDMFISS